MDRYSYLIYFPYNRLLLGVFLLLMAVISACTGRVPAAYHGIVYRSEDPSAFWFNIAIYCVVGGGFIAFFAYRVR